MQQKATTTSVRVPWNNGRIAGQKPPLKRNEIWANRVRLRLKSFWAHYPQLGTCSTPTQS